MFAKKANKVYRVDEESKDKYLKQGYDITDDKGNVIERSPQSMVPYAEYEAVLKELAELKGQQKADEKPAKKSGKKETADVELDPDA